MMLEWILGTAAALMTGLNIFQVVFWRIERQKMKAEADSATAQVQQKNIELAGMFRQQLAEALNETHEARLARSEDEEKYLNVISGLRIEIVNLKDEITSLKKEIENLREDSNTPKPKKSRGKEAQL